MSHEHADMFTQEFWDERYSTAHRVWSGRPNPILVTTVKGLTPGTALDVGCGEGGDAIWLARQGWYVTGVDVSTVALSRAAEEARTAGPEIADRITWQQADALTWDPAPQTFDLVSAQFIHLPGPGLASLHRRLAAAVRPGGTLLIVGHHRSDLETTIGRPNHPELMFTADELAATLDHTGWQVTTEEPEREETDREGRTVMIRDAVLRAVRISP